MRWFGLVIGVVIVLGSAISFAAPEARLWLEHSVLTSTGLDVIAVVRVAIGLGFLFAASVSRQPRTIRALGIIVIIAGVMTPWFGVARARAAVNWFEAAGPFPMHLEAVAGVALGSFVIYAFRAPIRRAS
jgi:hypothetical protein